VNIHDGEIRNLNAITENERADWVEMEKTPTPKQLTRKRIGRNDPCPCGSGKKFKKCHLVAKR
jgi:uncharacterized protein YecA (UPF0149 family)